MKQILQATVSDNVSAMNLKRFQQLMVPLVVCLGLQSALTMSANAQNIANPSTSGHIIIVELQGKAEFLPEGAKNWYQAQKDQEMHPGDKLQTGSNSRLVLKWYDDSVIPLDALTYVEILPADKKDSLPGLHLFKGVFSFFHRGKPDTIKVLTHGSAACVLGTEFLLASNGDDDSSSTYLAVMDGSVRLQNKLGEVLVTNNQQAVTLPGEPPRQTAGFIANNLLQWCFYYPGVVDPAEFALSDLEIASLKPSLDAYRSGDLLSALSAFPELDQSQTESMQLYHAALLLSVGRVDKTTNILANLSAGRQKSAPASALSMVISAVKNQPLPNLREPETASEFIAASYYDQSRPKGDRSLVKALEHARKAAELSPGFGFAWERVAELEFGFGRIEKAESALDKSLALSPRNAQALTLKGFLLAAQNRVQPAIDWFDKAIAVDAGLGNAWLGRGLCRIRLGQTEAGQKDLLVAAAQEPNRSLLRSYLAKAFSIGGKSAFADKELERAIALDPADPTGWFYSALIKQKENRVNEAIHDLEKARELNDNRSVYRSKMLLDQDKSVRSVNLANIYQDAGLKTASLTEAAQAVNLDYADSAAHLSLSDQYNELRDPTRFNLRPETVWFNELLLANLLAPAGAGRLSQTVSQQEYSKLFEADGLSFASDSLWRSDNQIHEYASQFGSYGNTSWALDLDYHKNAGVRPNNALDSKEWYTTIKQQLTPHDSLLILAKYQDYDSGDNFQYYDPSAEARPHYHFTESQKPIVIGAFQHEWAQGIETLLMGGRLQNQQQFSDINVPQLILSRDAGIITGVATQTQDVTLRDELQIYTAELNQIVQHEKFTFVGGGRWQGGHFDFSDSLNVNPPALVTLYPPVSSSFREVFDRYAGYGYLTVEPISHLWLTGGIDYDHIRYPANYQTLPQSSGTQQEHRLSPKAALVWKPNEIVGVRGMYARDLGGASLDESFRLEPTQLAGFAQTYRSIIPESVTGTLAGTKNEVINAGLDLKFPTDTFAFIQLQRLRSRVGQTLGSIEHINGTNFIPGTTSLDFNYEEQSALLAVSQLLPQGFVLGGNYTLSKADLRTSFPEIASSVSAPKNQTGFLHQLDTYLLVNHPSGLFARFDARGYIQSNQGYAPDEPGQAFAQFDVQGGVRMFQRKADLTLGVLNFTGQDYKLNPLNIYSELPRKAVFFVRFKMQL